MMQHSHPSLTRLVFAVHGSFFFRQMCMPVLRLLWPGFPLSVTVRGQKMFANSWDRYAALLMWKYKLLESFESVMVRRLTKPGMIVVDVGANIGLYTLEFARLVGPSGKVHAFEPSRHEAVLLRKGVAANGYHNVIIHEDAVSNKTGMARLFISEDNKGDHKIFDTHDNRRSIPVRMVALDDVIQGRIDIIKIDIQGAEIFALQGMKSLLRRNKQVKLLVEFCPSMLEAAGRRPSELLDELVSLGFRCSYIDESRKCVVPATPQIILSLATSDFYLNLFCER